MKFKELFIGERFAFASSKHVVPGAGFGISTKAALVKIKNIYPASRKPRVLNALHLRTGRARHVTKETEVVRLKPFS